MDLEITQIPEKEELQKHQQEGPGKKGKIGHSCEAMVWKKGWKESKKGIKKGKRVWKKDWKRFERMIERIVERNLGKEVEWFKDGWFGWKASWLEGC